MTYELHHEKRDTNVVTSASGYVAAGQSSACQFRIHDLRITKSGISLPEETAVTVKFLLGVFHNNTNQVKKKIRWQDKLTQF